MTVRYLFGTYSSGYTLNTAFSGLYLTSSARIGGVAGGAGSGGGVGLTIGFSAGFENKGSILGGVGGAAAAVAGAGGGGGTGVYLQGVSTDSNFGVIAGGAGGAGGYDAGGAGGVGGAGGFGIVLGASGKATLLLTAGAVGGQGGVGASASTGHAAGAGGSGGLGLLMFSNTSIILSGAIGGGQGGAPGSNLGKYGGAGGGGGYGVLVAFSGSLDNEHGLIRGGDGHVGGYGYLRAGAGGGGGRGVVLFSGADMIDNGGQVVGGAGGAGGYSYRPSVGDIGGAGGAGGSGIYMDAARLTLAGAITGGAGGAAGASNGAYGAAGGAGGAGASVVGGGIITNTGGGAYGGDGGSGTYGFTTGGAGGAGGAGVIFSSGGTLVNARGTIAGGHGGSGGLNHLLQSGGVGLAGNGVQLGSGGIVVNGAAGSSSALIEGRIGVFASPVGLATVTNFGTIAGSGGVSVQLTMASDRLIAEAGSTFIGAVLGGGGTLELAGGTGGITGLGASGSLAGSEAIAFSGFGAYVIDKGGPWILAGTNVLRAGVGLLDSGILTIAGSLANAGTVSALTGSQITLHGAHVTGGTLFSTPGVTIRVAGAGNILDGTGAGLTSQASLSVSNKSALTLEGAIINQGVITLAGKSQAASLLIGAAGAILSGAGQVAMGDGPLDVVQGTTAGATLTNLDNTLSGAGLLGAGKLTLVNAANGVIDASGTAALVIDTGAAAVANAGLIEATGKGGATIAGAVVNTGILSAAGGNLTVMGAVSGAGSAMIAGGTLFFASTFTQNVDFTGAAGVLALANSQAFTGTVSGFSLTGGTSFDLRDIGFVGKHEASFSGTPTGGVLTVTDGTHVAKITLVGNYLGSTWIVSSDHQGGVIVIDPSPQRFIAAAATLSGSTAGGAVRTDPVGSARPPVLALPVA